MKCDLHLHSNCSDGQCSPEKLVRMAKEKGLKCISVTDHDTVDGVKRAMAEGRRRKVKVLCGVELSTVYNDTEVHILAYNIDLNADGLGERLSEIRNLRNERNKALVEKLRAHGLNISLENIVKDANKSIGRPDIAQELVRCGYCFSVKEAFDKYIGKGQCCYVQTRRLTPKEAILLATSYGGSAVLAHPRCLGMDEREFENFLQELVNCGLGGIEAEYFAHTTPERNYYKSMAKKYNLFVTGGSDFHDAQHGLPMGAVNYVPNATTRKVLKI